MKTKKFLGNAGRKWLVCALGMGMSCTVNAADFDRGLLADSVSGGVQSHPVAGVWKKQRLVRVSDQRAMREPAQHYKCYADSVMLSIWCGKRNNSSLDVSFSGTCGTVRYLSDMAVCEGEAELHVKKENENQFRLTWYDERSEAFEEEWSRADASFVAAFASFLKNVLHPEVKNRFIGVWKAKGIRLLPAGVMVEAPFSYYKVYGEHVFFSFEPRIKDGLCQTISGQAGAFEVVSDSLIQEKGGQNEVKWLDENHFKMAGNNGRRKMEILWERTQLPDEYRKVLEGVENLAENH